MERKLIKTADGSTTIFLPEWNEHYHSVHGAIQEAVHVFINTGLDYVAKSQNKGKITLLEIGFGTGLNAFLSLLEAQKRSIFIDYTGIEAYPVSAEEIGSFNYPSFFSEGNAAELFSDLHKADWGQQTQLSSFFKLHKRKQFFADIEESNSYDLIYFDAFSPRVQPDLWTGEIFEKMTKALKDNGVLVTYSAKGSVRRAMQEVGFTVERLPGPPGKREMLRGKI